MLPKLLNKNKVTAITAENMYEALNKFDFSLDLHNNANMNMITIDTSRINRSRSQTRPLIKNHK